MSTSWFHFGWPLSNTFQPWIRFDSKNFGRFLDNLQFNVDLDQIWQKIWQKIEMPKLN